MHRHPFPIVCLVMLVLAASASSLASELPARINDSGQAACYEGQDTVDIDIVPCDSMNWPGQDGAQGRDAEAELPKLGGGRAGFDFTKIARSGAELPADAPRGAGEADWACTRDNVTGLVWSVATERDASFSQARQFAAAANADGGLCGFDDWRLPSGTELLGLIDYGDAELPVDPDYFPSTPTEMTWTGEPDPSASTERLRVVNFVGGYLNPIAATDAATTRIVRGGGDFGPVLEGADGELVDPATGLVWDRCLLGQNAPSCEGSAQMMSWHDALLAVAARNAQAWRGHSDWRLPNVKELASLVDASRAWPTIDAGLFPRTASAAHWSSTTHALAPHMAWAVFFGPGDVFAKDKATKAAVRLVRTGVASTANGTPWPALSEDGQSSVPPATLPETLPIIRLSTEGAVTIPRSEYVAGEMVIENPDGEIEYQGAMLIHGRGNSTWIKMPKKPYRIKLDSKAKLLGMPKSKHWVLLANYADKSLLRTALAMEMGDALGMAWNPRTRMVEVEINGEYQGLYQLGEKIRIDKDRVDIAEMEPEDTSAPEVTGGYLLEIDARRNCDPLVQFDTTRGTPFCIEKPDEDDINVAQYQYITDYLEQTEKAIYAPDFTDPNEGYAKWLDPASFIDWYLVNEVTSNPDARSFSSIWNYKDRDGTLHRGPLWDFDLSSGNDNQQPSADPQNFWIRGGTWYARLFQDPVFTGSTWLRWQDLKALMLDDLDAHVDALAASLGAARQRNFERWPILAQYDWPNVVITGSWQGELAYLKAWLHQRINWLDEHMPEPDQHERKCAAGLIAGGGPQLIPRGACVRDTGGLHR